MRLVPHSIPHLAMTLCLLSSHSTWKFLSSLGNSARIVPASSSILEGPIACSNRFQGILMHTGVLRTFRVASNMGFAPDNKLE